MKRRRFVFEVMDKQFQRKGKVGGRTGEPSSRLVATRYRRQTRWVTEIRESNCTSPERLD
ncbi:hypothetical protein RB1557 [Rhodopirellula baltica SH 1]|uniref:Uncharacterized protein n=1 Tax=Rhodopirellula baltica (strain DSM 10527 / NCIMB 13988 / SH1) TaxID=243090 RepID=Q7UX53_RHOBA|nr:hypothetical protein RB1557 [Rhodopirellula baltica SH 1]